MLKILNFICFYSYSTLLVISVRVTTEFISPHSVSSSMTSYVLDLY